MPWFSNQSYDIKTLLELIVTSAQSQGKKVEQQHIEKLVNYINLWIEHTHSTKILNTLIEHSIQVLSKSYYISHVYENQDISIFGTGNNFIDVIVRKIES